MRSRCASPASKGGVLQPEGPERMRRTASQRLSWLARNGGTPGEESREGAPLRQAQPAQATCWQIAHLRETGLVRGDNGVENRHKWSIRSADAGLATRHQRRSSSPDSINTYCANSPNRGFGGTRRLSEFGTFRSFPSKVFSDRFSGETRHSRVARSARRMTAIGGKLSELVANHTTLKCSRSRLGRSHLRRQPAPESSTAKTAVERPNIYNLANSNRTPEAAPPLCPAVLMGQ